jgi:hypothetical protein
MKNIMAKLGKSFLALLFTASLFSISSVEAAPGFFKWDVIGSKTVDYKVDRDVFNLGPRAPKYTKLQFKVTGAKLNMHRCIVHYMNGSKQEIKLKGNFNPGDVSRVIDLKGDKRKVDRIVFVYDTKNRSRRKAKVLLLGYR